MDDFIISVPIMSSNLSQERRIATLEALKKVGAKRVFIGMTPYFSNPNKQIRTLNELKVNVDFFKSSGLEVGAWILSSMIIDDDDVQYKLDANGNEKKPWRCHADNKLLEIASYYATEIAKCGVDLIMYDDDFHHSHYEFGESGLRGCTCKHHRAILKKLYGDKYDFDFVIQKASEEEPNEFRVIWEEINAYALKQYAKTVRDAVDKVNPNIRMGIANCMANWGIELLSAEEISYILAGKTKPFMRVSGAPYWCRNVYGSMREFSNVVEFVRYQSERLKNSNIETMGEGDVFPRPRTAVSSSLLEAYDTVLRVDGNLSGNLKYMLSYDADVDYETGYIDRHIENEALYKEIVKHFANKTSCGVKIYHNNMVFRETNYKYILSENYNKNIYKNQLMTNQASRYFSLLSIPTTYTNENYSGIAVFGENARFVEESYLDKGLILDVPAALELRDRGIDVGLEKIDGVFASKAEYFPDGNLHLFRKTKGYFKLSIKKTAKVLSYYLERNRWFADEIDEIEKTPAAYLYENDNGQRFCVLAFAAHLIEDNVVMENEICCYAKSRQIADACEWVSKKSLCAKCLGNPNLYMICKKDQNTLSVALWNMSQDKIFAPKITIDEKYSSIVGVNCLCELNDNEVKLSTLNAFDFCFFTLEK